MIMKLLSFFTYLFRLFKSMIFMPVLRVTRKVRTLANPQLYAMKLAKLIGGFFKKKVKLKPQKMSDYLEFKYKYVAKSLFVIIPLLIVALVYFSITVVHPWVVSKYFTAVFFEDNTKLEQYNGKVQVLLLKNKSTSFQGKLENGLKTGYGRLYLENGTILYDGNFANDLYEGYGKLYNDKGKPIYKGQFAAGEKQGFGKEYLPEDGRLLYEGNFETGQKVGEGILYFENGTVEYKGSFSAGEKQGEGALYTEDGAVVYKGAFAAGQKEGKGILYSKKGTVEYKGDFVAGQPEGQGTKSDESGKMIYKGAFAAGKYEGERTLYNKDGSVLYSGSFSADAYSGKGKLYLEGVSRYIEGEFLEGKAQGAGVLYNEGLKVYEGSFFAGEKQGEGKLYSKSGEVVFQGIFLEGSMSIEGIFGIEAPDLATFFPQKAEYGQYEDCFTYIPRDAGCLIKLNYALEELPAEVQEIYFWKSETSGLKLLADKEVKKDTLDILLGKATNEGYQVIGPVPAAAAAQGGFDDIGEGARLYTKTFAKAGLTYVFYFLKDSDEIKLLKIGKAVENE